ncbi:MAG: glycine/betaine/sarcosine/D-proline family reductase selenoprotein B [Deltaproteobacteria bacterium]|nr:glycine/betaine/sarcosine/D-proline family reductase selenoprotein B [Deltaproteobacteria bacterium]
MVTVVHVVNQFFAGMGGEDKAGVPVGVVEGATGAARGLQSQLGERATVVATIYFGDNYFHEHIDEAKAQILKEIGSRRPDVVVAGPAFNSGRYGVSCVEICHAVADSFGIPCVTAMHEENPAVDTYREYRDPKVFLLPTKATAAGMSEALIVMARLACRLGSGEELGPAREEGYVPRGIRRLERSDRPGVERAIDLLLKRLRNEPFVTEIPVQIWDRAVPAAPLAPGRNATVAVITTSGVVPWGNPDRFKTYRNTFWRKYNISELKMLERGKWEAVHGGYNVAFMNQNPHYGLPLDALRALESDGGFRLYHSYYVVPGNQGSPSVMQRIGQEISADLKKEQVDGVLLVAT